MAEILPTEEWIIDGNYSRTLEIRMRACDTVFFFDLPTQVCLEGAAARVGKVREEMPWIETALDPEFKKEIEDFPSKNLPTVYALFEKYSDKRIVIFRSRGEADKFLEKFV
jgi:adenylate kinase family enzyme